MTQLNTPYPATAYLTGFLRGRGYQVAQADLALELFLALYSRAGLTRVAQAIAWENADAYIDTVDAAIRYLQGRDPNLAHRIASREFLPEGERFNPIAEDSTGEDPLGWAFGGLGIADRAKHLASLYVDDIADVLRQVDPDFELSRYREQLAAAAQSFAPLRASLEGEPTLIDTMLDELVDALIAREQPDLVGLTVPFPGNVYAAFRIARRVEVPVALGGGYVNTELRELDDPAVFDYVDYITLDDGEGPMLALIEHLEKGTPLHRTLVRSADKVVRSADVGDRDVPFRDSGTPTYDGLRMDRYVSLFEMLNPMHRLWSDGRWNKLTIAHGCYWKQCTFCDTSLDYIARYDRAPADILVDRIEALIAETGQTGFHFVDEAAPPAGLRALAEKILERKLTISWWGNVRFEKAFTPELCELLARSGCVAVSGGLEVASDRLLTLMKKGVTVEQVARVTRAFTDAGVMVHAYLMYGFPTETAQDTIDALERVRQLFAEGCLQSAFWHRFVATVHSPIGKAPELYGIRTKRVASTFANNDLPFEDPTGTDHDYFAPGLRKAVYNYMHGLGLDDDPRVWFPKRPRPPATSVPSDLISSALRDLAPYTDP